LGKAKEVPSGVDESMAVELLESIHDMARKATSADFSNLCGVCSIFVTRSLDISSSSKDSPVIEAYRKTLADFMTRKSSSVHPNFILDFIRRFPQRAWPLHKDLCDYVAPGAGVNPYRQLQAYGMLQILSQQLSTLSKTVDSAEIRAFLARLVKDIYGTFEVAAKDSTWKAARLKEVAKFALHLARISKTTLQDSEQVGKLWDLSKLDQVESSLRDGEKTKEMKSILGMLKQLKALLGGSKDEGKKQKGKRSLETSQAANGMDVDTGGEVAAAGASVKKVKKNRDSSERKPNGDIAKTKTQKEAKSGEGKKVKTKPKAP